VVSRSEGYIGVMIDDLTTRGVSEPYRMFTSRAEFRLRLRADNADQRLTPAGIALGIVGPERRAAFEAKAAALAEARAMLEALSVTPTEAGRAGLDVKLDGRRRSAYELMALPGIDFARLRAIWPELGRVSAATAAQIEVDARYQAYVDRQADDVAAMKKDEGVVIPAGFTFTGIPGLSTELQLKLTKHRPGTLAQAGRIDGMTPAGLMILLAYVKRGRAA
jgi:tRNA uridine 5-carboxymethylaminomethyl modification enzyme